PARERDRVGHTIGHPHGAAIKGGLDVNVLFGRAFSRRASRFGIRDGGLVGRRRLPSGCLSSRVAPGAPQETHNNEDQRTSFVSFVSFVSLVFFHCAILLANNVRIGSTGLSSVRTNA